MGGIGIGESEAYFWIRFEYRDPMGSIILGRLRYRTDGKQEITFYPTSLGVYLADARSKGEPLKGSPLSLEVVPEISLTIPRNHKKVVPGGIEIPFEIEEDPTLSGPKQPKAGQPLSQGIPLSALGTDDPSEVSLTVKNPEGKVIPSDLTFDDGEPFINFLQAHPGTYMAELFVDNTKTLEVPIDVLGDPNSLDSPQSKPFDRDMPIEVKGDSDSLSKVPKQKAPGQPVSQGIPLSSLGVNDPSKVTLVVKNRGWNY